MKINHYPDFVKRFIQRFYHSILLSNFQFKHSTMFLAAISMLNKCVFCQIHLVAALLLRYWIWIPLIFCLGSAGRFIKSYIIYRPENMFTCGLPTVFGQWLTSLIYHLVAMNVVRDGYQKVRFCCLNKCDKNLT